MEKLNKRQNVFDMAQQNRDFERGAENGSLNSFELIYQTGKILMPK